MVRQMALRMLEERRRLVADEEHALALDDDHLGAVQLAEVRRGEHLLGAARRHHAGFGAHLLQVFGWLHLFGWLQLLQLLQVLQVLQQVVVQHGCGQQQSFFFLRRPASAESGVRATHAQATIATIQILRTIRLPP